MSQLSTVTEVVDALGGIQAAAAIAGVKHGSIRMCSYLGKFPARTYLVMTEELERLGYAAPPSLWGMAGADPPPKKKRKRTKS